MAKEDATSSVIPAPAANARSSLVGWANQQDAWIRTLVSTVIVTAKPLADNQLDTLYDVFLREKHLRSGDAVAVEELRDDAIDAGPGEQLLLKRLEELRNVNALAPDQSLVFAPRLTIVFGENASGKTGYVRVLKRAAAVRTAETILTDINVANAGQVTARFVYAVGGQEFSLDWQNEAGVAPLNRIDVFDSRATLLHLDTDLTYIYTPGELSRFPLVQQAVDQIRVRLEAEIKQKTAGSNPFVAHFERVSRLYTPVESLGASTDLSRLRQLAAVTVEEEAQLPTLRTEIDALRSTNPQVQLRVAESQKQNAAAVAAALKTVQAFDFDAYAKSRGEYVRVRERYETATTTSFAGVEIPGILQAEWKQFIQAGEEYLKQLEGSAAYPATGDVCAYCRQPLTPEAMGLIRKYRDYCNGEFRTELNRAEKELGRQVERIVALDFRALAAQLADFAVASGFLPAEQQAQIAAVLERGEQLKTALATKAAFDSEGFQHEASAATAKLDVAADSTSALIGDLKGRAEQREQSLKERQAQLLDIESRQKLAKLLPDIEKYVDAAKWADMARTQYRRFPQILRSLTEASKTASDELLNRDFERRFGEECQKLRAPKVRLEFPGRQGQVTRRKALAPDRRLSEVLSEGEQKVIAIADFLAEIALKPPAPVIFDDPINSLDYRRMSEVVARIVELSQTRQIIVFTHNIWFTTELLSAFEKTPQDCAYYDVTRDGGQIGLVSKGSHPRSDTFKTSRGKINELIQVAQKLTGEPQLALVEKGYEYLRNVCEVIVESELLQGVTQRYQPNVRMTSLPNIKYDRLQAAVQVIYPIYEDCCRRIASHSQPLETLNVRPTLDQLKQDWEAVQNTRTAYLA